MGIFDRWIKTKKKPVEKPVAAEKPKAPTKSAKELAKIGRAHV